MEFVHGLGDSGTPGSTSSSPPAGSNSSSPPKRIWDGMEHGINNQPKRMPAYFQPPPVYNRFAAGGGRPMLRLPEPSDCGKFARALGRLQCATTIACFTNITSMGKSTVSGRHFSGQSSTAMRNPFEVGRSPISAAATISAAAAHQQVHAHATSRRTVSTTQQSSVGAASTVFMAAGTEWRVHPRAAGLGSLRSVRRCRGPFKREANP